MNDRHLLEHGRLEVRARVLPASNVTLLGTVTDGHRTVECVYKPVSGERPLWDFREGTLAGREVAAYVVSEALGWGIVPPTVLRDGPVGAGMVQAWRDPDPDQQPVDVVDPDEVPDGYLHVLDAVDADERPVALIHEDTPALRRMALFDAVVNNADRKGGHVLAMRDGHRFGVDHGVCFHHEPKLRTVLWGWATLPLTDDELTTLRRLLDRLETAADPLAKRLASLLDDVELAALRQRCNDLLAHARMPLPSGSWPAIPWPAF